MSISVILAPKFLKTGIMTLLVKPIINLYDKQVLFWERPKIITKISSFLVLCFICCSLLSFLVYNKIISLGHFDERFKHPFFAVEVAFTILLILELLTLIFVLPKSVSRSLGKQFELLSLIFLRNAFKEFSRVDDFLSWTSSKETIINMLVYSFGALAIFCLMGITQRVNRQIRLSETYVNQVKFVRVKKLLALFLLGSFMFIGIRDLIIFFQTGVYLHSFDTFYSVLIFTDITIVLVALRYTINYYRVFRYSAFVLATILIRISLTLESGYNVLLGVLTTLFVLLLAVVYTFIQKGLTERELKT